MNLFKFLKTIYELLGVFLKTILFRRGVSVKPYKVCWLITKKCNLRCCYCDIPKEQTSENFDMSIDEAFNIARQFKKLGVKFIALSGGEPLTYSHIFPLIEFLKKQGFIVGINTNGTLITDAIAKKLAQTGIDIIMISLDHPSTLQDEIRGMENCFSKIDKAIDSLVQYKISAKYMIGVQAVVSSKNYDKLDDLFVYAKNKGIDSVALQPTYIQPISLEKTDDSNDEFQIPDDKILYLKTKIKELSAKYPYLLRNSSFFLDGITKYCVNPTMPNDCCYGGGLTINISPEGYVGACHYMLDKQAGTLREKTLEQIMESDTYKSLLKKVRNKQCPTCWCPVMHEYNIFYHPVHIMKSLRLVRTANDGK